MGTKRQKRTTKAGRTERRVKDLRAKKDPRGGAVRQNPPDTVTSSLGG